jgi:hypothetical protein
MRGLNPRIFSQRQNQNQRQKQIIFWGDRFLPSDAPLTGCIVKGIGGVGVDVAFDFD